MSPELFRASVSIRKGAEIGTEDVSALLARFPPRLDTPFDTITIENTACIVHYSIDTSLQNTVSALFRRYHPRYGACIALRPSDGRVLAMVSYTNPEEAPLAPDLYCRGIFPAASLVKIISAAAAIETGRLTGESLLKTAGSNHTLYRFQLADTLKQFREVSLKDAFAYSINPVFGRIGIYVLGAATLREYLSKFGFNEQVPFDMPAQISRAQVDDSGFLLAECASGFNQSTRISPLLAALIAAAVSNDGAMPVPILVDSIETRGAAKCIYRAAPRVWRTPVGRAAARELRSLMSGVAQFGTARNSFVYIKRSDRFAGIEYGGKTGNIEIDRFGRVDQFSGFARHETDSLQHIAVGVVTVHGPYWTVHSSFVGAETIRAFIRGTQIRQRAPREKNGGENAHLSSLP
jgi:cell division protein FtsI/penicillin-binding protein 2